MKVVFLEEVEGTARAGDVKNVSAGFARNFLLPRKLAAPANEHYIAIAQAKAGKEARRQDRQDEEARQHLLAKVDGKAISIEVRVGEQGKLFGSVTARDIAEALQKTTRVELEHRQVDLHEPIRELGAHQVTVKLTRNVHATVTVNVLPLGGEEVEAEEAAATEASAEAPAAEAAAEEPAPPDIAETESEPEAEAEAEPEAEPEAEAAETEEEETEEPEQD